MKSNLNLIQYIRFPQFPTYYYQRKSKRGKKGNRNVKYFLCFLLAILLYSDVLAKSNELTTKYSMYLLGVNIGEFSVTQKNENGNVNIEAITDVKVSLLFSYHVKYVQNTVYEQGVLKSSNVKTYKNGKLNSDMSLKLKKDYYLLVIDGDTTVINDSITYSGSLIYFNEPFGVKQLYKERTAEIRQLTSISEHTYIIKDEKDRELNRYYYENGILQYAKMRHTLGNIELKLEMENQKND